MRRNRHNSAILLLGLSCILVLGCSNSDSKWSVRKSDTVKIEPSPTQVHLDDGVYPAIWGEQKADGENQDQEIVVLENLPVDGEESPPATIRVINQPLLHFRDVPKFDFTFAKNECTEIGFQNTDTLRSYTRDHVGARLAVVIDRKVISVHKIREEIHSDQVRITCCIVGGGDHLHKHLSELKLASNSGQPSEAVE